MNVDIAFSRALLSQVVADVKKFAPAVKMNDAWVYHSIGDTWEFHGPEGFYWYGSASNAYEARFKGWGAWLRSKSAPGYEREVSQ